MPIVAKLLQYRLLPIADPIIGTTLINVEGFRRAVTYTLIEQPTLSVTTL